MNNHDHPLVETVEPNLSQGMRQLKGLYSRNFNRRHKLVGHVFQDRYKAILVRKENYLQSRDLIANTIKKQQKG